ncbi:MAG: hypothetical protein HOY78_16710 [Saccharothrix sp.]|nr:hypothetical protein [Saccharothrix sp.]
MNAARLVRLANEALESGDPATAADRLVEAAGVHDRSGEQQGRAALLARASVLFRVVGRPDAAADAARTAWDTATDVVVRRSAAVELSEVARSKGDLDTAIAWLYRALSTEDSTGRARTLVRLANLEAAAGRFAAAVQACEEAVKALDGSTDATRVRLELSGALLEAGDPERATAVLEHAMTTDDPAILAEGHLVAVAIALRQHDKTRARTSAASARSEALRAGAAIPYLAAAAAEADLADDRVAAYESLAKAWVTLGDLVGRDAGRAMVRPLLLDLRNRWGADAFGQAKAAYEHRRRQATS